jgi:hypothetical protein
LPGRREDRAAGSIVSKQEVILQEIAFDELDEKDFHIKLAPNEQHYVLDTVRKMGYRRHPEGADPVASTLTEARKIIGSSDYKRLWLVLAIFVGTALQIYLISMMRSATTAGDKDKDNVFPWPFRFTSLFRRS